MVPDHGCTNYCREGEHCDLVYSGDHANDKLVRQSVALAYQSAYDVRVTRIQPATEAPDLSMFPAESLRIVSGSGTQDDNCRWLVWWRDEPRLYSTAEVAAQLGITPRRVQVLSQARGVGRQVGRAFVFTGADIDAMRERVPGRPAGQHAK